MLFVTGITCSGKTFLSKKLAEVLGRPYFSVGDWVRKEFPNEEHIGLSDRGQEINKKIMALSKDTICDGYPRTKEQLIFLRTNLELKDRFILCIQADYNLCLLHAFQRSRYDVSHFQYSYDIQKKNFDDMFGELKWEEYISVYQPINNLKEFIQWLYFNIIKK